MKNSDYFKKSRDKIVDFNVVLYSNKWPQSTIVFTKQQYDFYDNLSKSELNSKLIQIETQANLENYPNAGIIGTTKIYKNGINTIEIEGSLAVAEKLVLWIVESAVKQF